MIIPTLKQVESTMKKVPTINNFKKKKPHAQFSVTLTTNQHIHKSLKARKIEKTLSIHV